MCNGEIVVVKFGAWIQDQLEGDFDGKKNGGLNVL